jgi:hypothetical protein
MVRTIKGPESDLVVLGFQFRELQQHLARLAALRDDVQKNIEWTTELDNQWETKTEFIIDQQFEVAGKVAGTVASNHDELCAKAHVLMDYCLPNDGDIVHSLAASLCRDIRDIFTRDYGLGDSKHQSGRQRPRAATRLLDRHS